MPASSPISPETQGRSGARWATAASLTLVVCAAVGLSVFEINNDDAGFHVATGRWILAHGEVPLSNPFSYAEDGARWVQHQWLPAVAIAWVADSVGAQGLILVKAATVGLIVAVSALFMATRRVPAPFAAWVLAVCVIAGAFRFKERPLLVSVLAVVATIGLLLRWRDRDFAGRRLPMAAAVIPAVTLQLHAGGLYSLLAWSALVGSLVLQRRKKPVFTALKWFGLTLLLSIGGLAAFAPGGVDVLLMPLSFGSNAYWVSHLAEFRPLTLTVLAWPQWCAVVLVAAGAGLAVATGRPFEALLLMGFGYLGVRHQRLILPMAMAAAPAIVAVLEHPQIEATLQGKRSQLLGTVLLIGTLAAGFADQAQWYRMGLGEDGFDRRRHPVDAMARAAKLPGNAFVSDGLAGVWLWHNYDLERPQEHRILVHNCLECYKEGTYIDVYQKIRYGEPGWQNEVDRLGINTFLIKHTSGGERRFQKGRPNVRQHLFADPQWLLVDFDDVAALWVRTANRPANIRGLPDFPADPDTGRPAKRASWPDIKKALQEHARRHPKVLRSLVILAHRAAAAGDRATLVDAVKSALERGANDRIAAELTEVMRRFAGGQIVRPVEPKAAIAPRGREYGR